VALFKGEFQLLLYSTWVALPIDGCHKGLILHRRSLKPHQVAFLVTNAIVKITNHFLQCTSKQDLNIHSFIHFSSSLPWNEENSVVLNKFYFFNRNVSSAIGWST